MTIYSVLLLILTALLFGLAAFLFRVLKQKSALQRVEEDCLYGKWVLLKSPTHGYFNRDGWDFFNKDREGMFHRRSDLLGSVAIPDKEIDPNSPLHKILRGFSADSIVVGDPTNTAHAPFVDSVLQRGINMFQSIAEAGHVSDMPHTVVEENKGLLYWLIREGLFDRDLSGELLLLLPKISRKKRRRFLDALVAIVQSQETFAGAEPSAMTHLNMKAAEILQNDFVDNPDDRTRATGLSLTGLVALEDIRDR